MAQKIESWWLRAFRVATFSGGIGCMFRVLSEKCVCGRRRKGFEARQRLDNPMSNDPMIQFFQLYTQP